jgi:hypothetical protein
VPGDGARNEADGSLLLDPWLLSNLAPGSDLSASLRRERWSAPNATTGALPASSVMLGLVREVLTHRRIETTIT